MLFTPVVITDNWANEVPDFHIFLLDELFGPVILIFEVPPALIVYDFLEFLPFQVIPMPHHHVLLYELMAPVGDGFIVQLVPVSSKALDLMALLAPVDSIREDITIVGLVALAPAQWTHLVAPEGLGLHYLVEISNKLNLFQSI